MADNPKTRFLASLLSQEKPISSSEYQEYRAMLEKKLAAAEAKLRNRRRITVGMWIATAALFFAGLAMASRMVPIQIRPFGTTLFLLSYGLFYLSLLRLFMYLAFERRAAESVRNESRDALLLELSRKVDAIAQRLEKT